MTADEEIQLEIKRANLGKNLWQYCQTMLGHMTDKQKESMVSHITMLQLQGTYDREKIPNMMYNFRYDIAFNWATHKWDYHRYESLRT